jgi:protein-S-isoprenylcysteine O-methyltransferase Ste14
MWPHVIFSLALVLKVRSEDERLRAAFPGYAAYARRTKAFIPFVL